MEAERQNQPQMMVDIATGQEYLNGEPIPEEPPLEVLLFKFRQNHEASLPLNYSGNSHCDISQCFCDPTSVMENAEVFCQSLRKIAESRGRMCPYTIDNLLKDEIFKVLFEWVEMGDDWDPRDDDDDNSSNEGSSSTEEPNNNPNRETNQGASSSCAGHSNERLPQEEVLLNGISPISSTTSPPEPCAENGNMSTPNAVQTRSPCSSSSKIFAWAGLRLKNPALQLVRRMDLDEDSTSSEPEISQTLNDSGESDENADGAVEPVPETDTAKTTESSPELPSTTDENVVQSSGENQADLNPEPAVNEEPESETQEKETSSHHIDDSSLPECPTISDFDAQAAAVAVPNVPETIPAGDVTSANSYSLSSDNNTDRTENESVPSGAVIDKVAEPPNAPKSNSDDLQSNNNLAIAREKSALNTPKPTKQPANDTDSETPVNRRRWEAGKMLPPKQHVQQNDEQSSASEVVSESEEEPEDGEIVSQEDAQQAEVQKQTEAPVDKTMKATLNNEKRVTRSGTNSPVPFTSEERVRTRSRSSVPGPASVKRDRESRAAKKSAQSKISSLLGVAPETVANEENSKASSPAKDLTAGVGLRKRLRTSEPAANQSEETSTQHQTRSTVNKGNSSRKRPKILPDETSSDVPSSSSRSSTPTLDDPNHPETRSRQERRNSSSPSPAATRQSQKITKILEKPQTETSNEKSGTSTVEQLATNAEDSNSSDSDESSSSDSGESHVSEIPLAERLVKKRKREEKERNKALKGNKTSDETRSQKSERKRKKKRGLSLNLAKPESSAGSPASTLQNILPFRIPDLPTTVKKAEACKSTTSSILQAAKSQNLVQQQQKTPVETENQKVVTNDDDDDDILMIKEVEVPKKTTSAGVSSTVKRSNSTEGSTSIPKTIRISLTKDKSKGLTPQRSLSIPGTSPTNTTDNTDSSPGSNRIEVGIGKSSLEKSTSLPLSPPELNITPSAEVDLEDHSRWEFPQKTSPRKTPQISLGLFNSKTNESLQDKSKSQQPLTVEKLQSNTTERFQPSPDKHILTITGKELPASKELTSTPTISKKPADTPSISKKLTDTPSTSKDPKAIPSIINKVTTSTPSTPNQKSSSENAKQVSPSSTTSNDQASRPLRARKQIFDPKAEAAKPIPKPVPKVTKEIIQQQQVSKSVSGPTPSSSISKTATITTATSSTPQKEGSNLPSKNKEPATQSTPQKAPEKSQQQQQDKPSRSSESSARKETGESSSTSNVSAPQRDRSRSPQVMPKSTPVSALSATFADGEIRLLPNKPSTSNISPTSGSGGTWRRGGPTDNRREREIDFTDDAVDFETPPDDEEDRRRSSSGDRNRNRSGGSSRSSSGGGNQNYRGRGGGHQQPYHFPGPPRGGGGPPRQHYDGRGRGHPRGPSFSGGPPFSGGPRKNYGEESGRRSTNSESHEWGRDRRRDNDYRRRDKD